MVFPPDEWELVKAVHRVLSRMSDPRPMLASVEPFPVDPADVPADAVRAVRRTLLRNSQDGDDEELARLVVAVVIAALAKPGAAAEVPRVRRG